MTKANILELEEKLSAEAARAGKAVAGELESTRMMKAAILRESHFEDLLTIARLALHEIGYRKLPAECELMHIVKAREALADIDAAETARLKGFSPTAETQAIVDAGIAAGHAA